MSLSTSASLITCSRIITSSLKSMSTTSCGVLAVPPTRAMASVIPNNAYIAILPPLVQQINGTGLIFGANCSTRQ